MNLTFLDFLKEDVVTFGGKAFPPYGQIVILAGGAASGKGFVISNLLGINGKVIDVDAFKQRVIELIKQQKLTADIKGKIEKAIGKPVEKYDQRNPTDVTALHDVLRGIAGLPAASETTLLYSLLKSNPEVLPNLIFDVTLKDFNKFTQICNNATSVGYDKNNIHLVWVITDVQVAIQSNKDRGEVYGTRTTPDDVVVNTHSGAAQTLKNIVDLGQDIKRYMNGDIWFVFNNLANGDTQTAKSGYGGSYVTKANYVKIKKAGSSNVEIPQSALNRIAKDVRINF